MHRLKKLWKLLESRQKKQVAVLFVMIFFATMMEIVGIGLVVPLVGLIISPETLNNQLWGGVFRKAAASFIHEEIVFAVLGLMVLIYFVKTVFLTFFAWTQARFNLGIQADFSRRLFFSYLNRSKLKFQQNHTATYIQNINNEIVFFARQGYDAVFDIAINALLIVGAIILLLIAEPIATLIVFLIISIVFSIFQALSKIHMLTLGKIRKENIALRSQKLQQALFSTKEIILRNKADYFIEEFHKHSLVLIDVESRYITLRKFPRYLFELLAVIGLTVGIVYMVLSGTELTQVAPIIALFTAVFIKIMPSINVILVEVNSIRYADETISVIHEELSQPIIKTAAPSENITSPIHQIKFDEISFAYDKEATPLLKNISFAFSHGDAIGIIGPSGAGKSTLIDLFLGILSPDKGSIQVNGQNIQACLTEWQSKIGYVPQSIYLLDDTLKRNIAFAEHDEDIDEQKILKVAKEAQLEKFITKLPNGLDSVIGEDGGQISGGEKQRIALARALYSSPDILVLDEATSALDIKTEDNIMNTIYTLQGKRTLFIVTHRLSAVEKCDMLIEIENGKIKL
jgi:ABC-type multidrug transport system fused ATPase/permease subunit